MYPSSSISAAYLKIVTYIFADGCSRRTAYINHFLN
jgi:hypothetical protein